MGAPASAVVDSRHAMLIVMQKGSSPCGLQGLREDGLQLLAGVRDLTSRPAIAEVNDADTLPRVAECATP